MPTTTSKAVTQALNQNPQEALALLPANGGEGLVRDLAFGELLALYVLRAGGEGGARRATYGAEDEDRASNRGRQEARAGEFLAQDERRSR